MNIEITQYHREQVAPLAKAFYEAIVAACTIEQDDLMHVVIKELIETNRLVRQPPLIANPS